MEERRRHPRYALGVSARVASAAEHRLPTSLAVDISMGGVLLAFDEPLGFTVHDRLVISLDLVDGHFHAIGMVTRVERGTDFRTYLAIEFSDVRVDDFEQMLDSVGRGDPTVGRAEADAERSGEHG